MSQSEISNMEGLETTAALVSVEVADSRMFPGCKGLRANDVFLPRGAIFRVTGQTVDYRTERTLQIDDDIHIDPVDEEGHPTLGYYLNHSCDPNAYPLVVADVVSKSLVMDIYALKQINKGDEITVDYAFMESEIANSCLCACGSPKCRGRIISFKQLGAQEIEDYLSKNISLSKHLSRLLGAE